jgi:dTDP-4-dehydrorhamnose 3,5-epimerase
MKTTKTPLGLTLIQPKVFYDNRGKFSEFHNDLEYRTITKNLHFCRDFLSYSSKGVIRGLHYQVFPYQQAKLITVIEGSIFDVCVNLDTGEYETHALFSGNQLFIPDNFAHGFQVLKDNTIISYKVTNYYNKESERTIIYNDTDLNIPWPLFNSCNTIVSEKDLAGMRFKDIK